MSTLQSQPSLVGLQQTGVNSPVNNVVPIAINSLYLQQTNAISGTKQVLWVATGLTSSDWIVLIASAIRRTNPGNYSATNPNGIVTADHVGQLLVDIVTNGYGVTTTATVYVAGGGTTWYAI